jgi:archaellum component FlaC
MSNDAIKGIMIKYGADDSDFIAGQKAVNKELNQNKATASALDRQFKETFNANDITPLIKQQKYLTDALDASKDKAMLLEHEMSQINKDAENFDSVKYAKLEKQLANSYTESAKLEKSLNKVNQNVDAINTGNLDEMSDDFKRSADSAGQFSSTLDDTIGKVENFDTSVGGLLKTVTKLSPTLAIATTAVAGLAGAMFGSEKATNALTKVMMQLQPTVDATGVSMSNAVTATNELWVATGDIEGAITATNTAMSVYGDTIDTATGLTMASASMYQIQAQGIMDVSDASKIGSSAINDFEASNLEANAAIQASEDLMAEYPGMVDDIGDSFKEFGDTIATMGFSISETMSYLSISMKLGAKNTDEAVNAINEFFIRVTEGGTEVESALGLIGMSVAEVQTMFANGQGQEALAEVVFGLNNVGYSAETALASTALFGTMGEEFVTPMLQNQSLALTQLETAYNLNNQATSQLTTLLGGSLVPTLEKVALSSGMTTAQMENLVFKFEQGAFSAMTMDEKIVTLTAGLMVNGQAMGLSAEQAQSFYEKMGILTSSTATLSEKFAVLDGAMAQFLFSGVLTEEQMTTLTASIDGQQRTLITLQNAYNAAGGASGYLTTQLWENYGALLQQKTGTTEASWAAMDLNQKMGVLSQSLGLSRSQSKDLEGAFETLADSEATASEKTTALRDGMKILVDNGFTPNIEVLSIFIPMLSELAGGLDGSVIKSNALTGEFAGMGKALDPTNESLKLYIKRLEDSKSPMDKAKEKARDTAGKFADLGESAETAAGQVDGLNKALQTNATLPPPQSAPASAPAPGSYMTTPSPSVSAMSNAVGASSNAVGSPTFNATINISGSNLTAKEQYTVIKSAFEDLWYTKGRLL